jgi:hypothetical protein
MSEYLVHMLNRLKLVARSTSIEASHATSD